MAKVKIDAKTALEDIRAGMSDSALMDKHKLSAMGLQSLFDKLLQAGVISRSELEERIPLSQKSVDIEIYRCPACGMPQFSEFDECPQCGVIVSKFIKKTSGGFCWGGWQEFAWSPSYCRWRWWARRRNVSRQSASHWFI